MAVDDEDVVAHAAVKGHFCDDIHPCISELQRYHGEVGFGVL